MVKGTESGLASPKRSEGGQVLLIIILVMVAVLTVGLSVVSRSITNLRTTREEASSQKALSAAEAGIEQVLKTNISIPIGTSFTGAPLTTYGTSITAVSGNDILVNGGNLVPKDEGADIWLVSHNADGTPNLSSPWNGTLQIFWGDTTGACNNAALEVVVIFDPSPHKFGRYVYDPCPGRRSNNNFSPALGAVNVIDGKSFSYSFPIAIPINSGYVVRVIPLYFSSSIGARASVALPSQGIRIDSTGDSGGTKRKLLVFKGYPQLPIQYFSYGLFSP